MALAAGRQNELAVDGLFTDVFVQGISGRADTNGDGFVTFNELQLYTQQRVTARSNGRQNPMAGPWEGGGQVVFRCGDAGLAGETATSPAPAEATRAQAPAGMAWIPGGTFAMGCSPGDSECDGDEEPAHQVRVNSFWMDATEVTQAQFQSVMGSNPSNFSGCPNCPVETVMWDEAQSYCQKTGKRLPTEAEWEFAARGGTNGSRYGDIDAIAWYNNNSGMKMHPVGQKQPNAYGLYDMLGNVWEWLWDWKANYPSGSVTDPAGPGGGSYRVFRGGSWFSLARDCRSAYRDFVDPGYRDYDLGFRLSRSLP
jgi:formylglycine-generating enzyme required for sulfatase activity